MSNETHAPIPLTQQTVNEYQLGDVINHVALGVVYEAINTTTQARVHFHQLSTLSGESPPPDRFKHAMFSVRGIESPHLTPLDGFGRDETRALSYVVYQAENLRPLISAERFGPGGALASGAHAISLARRWTANLLDALKVIHAKRATHLALAPEALWLTDADQLSLSQQGIAIAFKRRISSKLSPDALTDDPTLLARASYVSPEEIRGRLTQPIADLYAVACLLCEWLTGAPPFRAERPEETLKLHLTCPAQDSPSVRALPAPLKAFFERALSKESKGRFGAAHEMLSALNQALDALEQPTPIPAVADASEWSASGADPEQDEEGLSTLYDAEEGEGGEETQAELPAPADSAALNAAPVPLTSPLSEEDELLRTTPVPSIEPSAPEEGEPSDELSFGGADELAFGGADELAFGGADELGFGGADELGFSQSQSDERTFLEFSDVDDQTVFEANIEDEIEEVHKSSVVDAAPISAAQRISTSLDRIGPPIPSPIPSPAPLPASALVAPPAPTPSPAPASSTPLPLASTPSLPSLGGSQSEPAAPIPSFKTEALSSVQYDGGTPAPSAQPTFEPPVPFQTLGYGSNLTMGEVESRLKASSDEIAELEIEEALVDELDPSRVMPLPSLNPHGFARPQDDFGLEGVADLSSIRPLQSPQPQIPSPPLSQDPPSPFATPVHQSAPVTPTPSPFAQPPSQVAHMTPAPSAPAATPSASAPPSPKAGGPSLKLLISVAVIFALLGGGGWAVMTGVIDLSALKLGGGPVSLNISTQPEGQTQVGLFIQNSIRASVPYEYQYTQGEQIGEETPVRFVWGTSLIKTKVPVFEGNTWVRLFISPPHGVTDQAQVERVIVTSNVSEALVSLGLAPIGHTPLVLFGARGQTLELIVEAPGQEELLNVTFGETKSIEATFTVAQ